MSWSRPRPYQAGAPESCPPHLGRATRQPSVRRVAPPLLRSLRRSSRRYERIRQLGGGVHSPPYYFGVYLDVPPITVRSDRARADLGLELTPMEQGLRETFVWYEQQRRPRPDFSWEDEVLASAE